MNTNATTSGMTRTNCGPWLIVNPAARPSMTARASTVPNETSDAR